MRGRVNQLPPPGPQHLIPQGPRFFPHPRNMPMVQVIAAPPTAPQRTPRKGASGS